MFWMLIALFVVTTVAGELLRPKPKFDAPKASSLGDFSFPTAEEGRAVPVVFGTCRVKGPNVAWYGNLKVVAITEKVKTGMFTSETVPKGHKYYMDVQAAICHGQIDAIIKLQFDTKDAVQSQSSLSGGTLISVNDPSLYGGDESEGGVLGDIEAFFGSSSQPVSSYLAAAVGSNVPAYRGVAYLVFKQFYFGTSNYVKTFSVDVRRCPNQLGLTGGKHNINGDANPACCLYEIISDYVWGLGIASAQIDTTSFVNAGNTLYSEGMGMSMLIDTQKEAQEWINEILRHIDAVLYTDPATGLFTLTLARGGYVLADLPLLNASNILDMQFSRGSWAQTTNTIKATYIDREQEFSERVVQAQDLANIQARNGELATESIAFNGIGIAAAANKAAYRALKTLSYPLAKMTIDVNREAWNLRPGSLFRLDWPPEGIQGMATRVVSIEYGNLLDGKIRIEAIEDIWGTLLTVYAPPGSTDWIDPVASLDPLIYQRLEEVPYHFVLSNDIKVMCLGVRQHETVSGDSVWSDKTGGTNYINSNTINSTNSAFYLIDDLLANGDPILSSLTVTAGEDYQHITSVTDDQFTDGANISRIGTEYIAFKNVVANGDGTLTLSPVWRGVLDTIPEDHSAGAIGVHFEGIGLMQIDPLYGTGTVTAKFLTFNGRDSYPIGSATQLSLVTTGRAAAPYPPGKVQVNGLYSPSTTVGASADLTWNHRSRDQRKLVSQDAADTTATPEGTYTVKTYINGVLIRTNTGVTGKTFSYTGAQRIADNSNGGYTTRLEIIPVNGSHSGKARHLDFVMTGLGMCLGDFLGGIEG